MNSAVANPTTSTAASMSATMRRAWALVRPSGSAPRPRTISLLSMVSTSTWMAACVLFSQVRALRQPEAVVLGR
jgi:hypothetical protein